MTSILTDQRIMLRPLSGAGPIELVGVMTVGRGSTCNLVIEQAGLSRKHAQLTVQGEEVLVEDFGSTNSTFVNGVKTEGVVTAKDGDIIKFATFAYEVSSSSSENDGDLTVVFRPSEEAINKEVLNKDIINKEVVNEEVVDAKVEVNAAPKSWALDNTPSVDGTQLMSLDARKKMAAAGLDNELSAEVKHDDPVLVCLSGALKGKVFKFSTVDTISKWEIGRSADSDIVIDDKSVSTHHAQLIHENKRWKLVDLMSANGTYINDTKGLTSYLSSGDRIRFGEVDFQFSVGNEANGSSTAGARKSSGSSSSGRSKITTLLLVTAVCSIAAAAVYFIVL